VADYNYPAHDLEAVKAMVRVGFLAYRPQALDTAAEMDMDRHDINECILGLECDDFHKSMDALNPKWAGARQDVYKPQYGGEWLYVKFQLWPVKVKRLYILSFKRKVNDDDDRD